MDQDVSSFTSALRRGDEEAWAKFHAEYYIRLFRWLLALSHGDEDAAGEAAHLTFLRAVRRVPQTGDAAQLWRWMTRLARSAYIDEWRRRKSRGALLRSWLDASEPPGLMPLDSDPIALLEECLASLEYDERLLLEEKYFNSQSVRVLAHARNLTDKALEGRLARARFRLRTAFNLRMNHAD